MTKSTQAIWAQKEIFMILPTFMEPTITSEQILALHKQISSWMCFSKDDTLLSVYLDACQKRLFELTKEQQKLAAKQVLSVAKNYKYSKEYLDLLYMARDLYEDKQPN